MARARGRRAPARNRNSARGGFRERALLFVPFRSWRVQLIGAVVAILLALSAHSFASATEGATTYRVRAGENLGSIARSTGVSIDKLVSLNGLKSPDVIIAGQELQLVTAAAAEAAEAGYAVKAGDTLWDIAVKNGVTVDALVAANQIANVDRLTVGQKLKVPAASALTQATVPRQAAANPLQQKVLSEARRVGGADIRLGVSARNLVTGERVAINAAESFASASVMKVPILVELERQVATGAVTWTPSLRVQAGAMISVSDNAAANQIAELVGHDEVNSTMGRLGLSGTRLVNPFTDSRNRALSSQNRTTPADMARLLELVATDQVISARASTDIRQMLAQNTDRSKLARLLPAEARVAHKSGWYDGVANDVGVITVERTGARWVIAVLVEDVPDTETGNQVIAVVSKAIYDDWVS